MRTPAQQNVIDNLRSGKYTQTHHCLMDDKGYCCLGVAAEVTDGIPFEINDDGEGFIPSSIDWTLNSSTTIPNEYSSLLGMNVRLRNYLMSMNDGQMVYRNRIIRQSVQKRDFNFIARYLEVIWPIES